MIVDRQKSQSREKDKYIRNGKEKNNVAKEKGPVVREKFQIAKKVDSKVYSKLNVRNSNENSKSVDK